MRCGLALLGLAACVPPIVADTADKSRDTSGDTSSDTSGDTSADTSGDTSADTSACVEPPVADAGPDLTADLAAGAVQLAGGGTGGCGPLTFQWAIQAMPAGSAGSAAAFEPDAATEDPRFTPDVAGRYVFSVAVYDEASWSSPDTVELTVR